VSPRHEPAGSSAEALDALRWLCGGWCVVVNWGSRWVVRVMVRLNSSNSEMSLAVGDPELGVTSRRKETRPNVMTVPPKRYGMDEADTW